MSAVDAFARGLVAVEGASAVGGGSSARAACAPATDQARSASS
jgi:hypothetical protein